MKHFLLSLMVLMMLTPGLACARFMPHHKASAPHMHMAKDMPCCPKQKTPPCDGTMLFKDCMHIDLQHTVDAPLLKKADIQKYTPALFLSDAFGRGFNVMASRTARGPPPDRQAVLAESQPVYLATLRLRI